MDGKLAAKLEHIRIAGCVPPRNASFEGGVLSASCVVQKAGKEDVVPRVQRCAETLYSLQGGGGFLEFTSFGQQLRYASRNAKVRGQ